LQHLDFIVWIDRFMSLQSTDTLELWLCLSIGMAALGPFAALTYYHFVPEAARRLPRVRWAVLLFLLAAWLLAMTGDFAAAVDRLLPLSRPGRAGIIRLVALMTFLLFAQMRLLGTPGEVGEPGSRRRTRVAPS
jgi:hypothetical protein